MSESRHSAHALGEVLPLQILFSATFFLSVGMLLDVGFIVSRPGLVAAAVGLILLVKLTTTALGALAVGASVATAGSLALLLAQVGEFSFVLERAGRSAGLSPADQGADGAQAFIAATVLLMAFTPGLAALGRVLNRSVATRPRRRSAALPTSPIAAQTSRNDHVLVSGWGDGARHVAADLATRGVGVVVVTLNPEGAAEAEAAGHDVVLGDSTKSHVLLEAGVADARMIVIADDQAESAARIAAVATPLAPQATVVVRTREDPDVAYLHAAGIHKVVSGDRASRHHLSATVLEELHDAAVSSPTAPRQEGPQGTVVDVTRVVGFVPATDTRCPHLPEIRPVLPSARGCEDCLRRGTTGSTCGSVSCGKVGCCDSSPNRHASAHFADTGHPLICSAEPGEGWACATWTPT
ncbi:MAG: NAD-binding protein [Actinomycetota bacterium]|nr:NAD-binding protein [Actinomycetota bacterium]